MVSVGLLCISGERLFVTFMCNSEEHCIRKFSEPVFRHVRIPAEHLFKSLCLSVCLLLCLLVKTPEPSHSIK